MKKMSELVEDIRTDLQMLRNSTDIKELDRVSDRLSDEAKEMRARASKYNDSYKWIAILERYGF